MIKGLIFFEIQEYDKAIKFFNKSFESNNKNKKSYFDKSNQTTY